MRILILTFYFEPDLSAGSFRASALVDALESTAGNISAIDVVTTLPNRYKSFSVQTDLVESRGRVTIHRLPVTSHKSGMADQAKAYTGFMMRALRLVSGKKYDLVFATSSRLMTAFLGALISRRTGAPLYLDIRDIFVDTLKDIVSPRQAALMVPLFSRVEKWTVNRASRVNLVSEGFRDYFVSRYPDKQFSWYTNGIDDEFLGVFDEGRNPDPARQPIKVLYAGNIGEGQGLHLIIPALASRLSDRVRFRIIGDGGRIGALQNAISERNLDNIEIVPPVDRANLIREYQDADVLFLHLNDHDAFKKVLPSKVFEYGSTGKPIWAGVSGFAASFIDKELGDNVAVFPPCNAEEALKVFEKLEMRPVDRTDFIERFARRNIMERMARELAAMAGK